MNNAIMKKSNEYNKIIDRLGRRKLFFIGLSGMTFMLFLLALCFVTYYSIGLSLSWVSMVLVLLFISFLAMSFSSLGWLIITEVFPLKGRGFVSRIGALSCWLFNGFVAFIFFKMVKVLTFAGTKIVIEGENLGNPAVVFFLYAILSVTGLIWGYRYLPETKGKTLEKIEAREASNHQKN